MSSSDLCLRVSRSRRCPVCDHADWCLVSRDGTTAICPRVESSKRIGDAGYLHRLKDEPWRPLRRHIRMVRLDAGTAPRADLARFATECQRAADPGRLQQLAASLGLSATSLCLLRIGWSSSHRAWSFPMTDASANVLGIRLRRPTGFKFSVTGGNDGLFIPSPLQDDPSPLLSCEGPTDAAALVDMGFLNVVGRPNCTGGIKLLVELTQRRQPAEVVIVADGDEPGQRGGGRWSGHILYYAQHATACCCRTCIAEWHNIPAGRELTPEEVTYLTDLVCMYVDERMPELTDNGEKVPCIRKKKVPPKG